jgi:hypothetical protein
MPGIDLRKPNVAGSSIFADLVRCSSRAAICSS